MKVRFRSLMLSAASGIGLSFAGLAASAHAQDVGAQGTDAESVTDEIIVTAQGRSESLQEVPVAVSVVTGETLVKANIRNLENLSQRLPGIRVQTAPAADLLNIRGVGSSLNAGFEQSVGTFVDGVYRGRSRSSRAAMFDVERVEVLKGPQTTFFGNNAIAGAFNITTRKAGKEFAVNASAFYAAEADEYSAELGVDMPLTQNLSFRFAGRLSGMDGYIKNDGFGKLGPNLDNKMGRLSMVWEPADNIKTEARIDVTRYRDQGVFNLELERCPPESPLPPRGACATMVNAVGAANINTKQDYRSNVGPSNLDLDVMELNQVTTIGLGFADLILNTGYYDHSFDNFAELHPFKFDITSPFRNVPGSPIRSTQVGSKQVEDYWQFSQEARLQSSGNNVLDYTAGLYYAQSKMKGYFSQSYYFNNFANVLDPNAAIVPNNTPLVANVQNQEKTRTLSAFLALTWNATDSLRFSPSLRYTRVRKNAVRNALIGSNDDLLRKSTFINLPGATAFFGPRLGLDLGAFPHPKRTFDDFMPAFGIEFDVNPDVMIYGTYTNGFKAGGFAQLFSGSEFDSETVDSFELGIKSEWFDRMLTLNVAAFHMEYKNLQESTTITLESGAIRSVVGNVAASKVKGIEVSANLRPVAGLELYTDVGYLDAKYSRYPGAPCTIFQGATRPAPCLQDLAGSVRAFSPKWSGSVGFNYTQDVLSDFVVRLNANLFFTSGFFVNASIDPYIYQPSFKKIDARISFGPSDERWEVALIGRNLTDKFTGSYRTPVAGAVGTTQFLGDPRRSVGIQLSLKY